MMRVHAQKQPHPQQQPAPHGRRSSGVSLAKSHTVNPILNLQRTIGDQSAQRWPAQTETDDLQTRSGIKKTSRFAHDFSRISVHAKSPVSVQAKLAVSSPADVYEREADRLSEQVMSMSASGSTHACACGGGCSECQTTQTGLGHETMRAKRVGSDERGQGAVPSIVDEVLRAPGESLDPETRANMEPRFGYNFSNVRVHTNERAAESARAVNALAYTVGRNIVFGAGQHAPSSSGGRKLLAHELAHVVQQGGGRPSHEGVGGPPVVSRAPTGVIARRIPLGLPEEVLEAEREKKLTVKKHEDAQRTVVALMEKARKILPDPKNGMRDSDNLIRNTVQMFDAGRFRLTVLSPTHYSPRLHFDTRVQHPNIGGDYPLFSPTTPGAGLKDEPGVHGKFEPAPSGTVTPIQPLPPKVERTPGEAPPKETPAPPKVSTAPPTFSPFAQGDVFLFTHGFDVESKFRQTFVHEGQHVADMSTQRVAVSPVDEKLEAYKSEFRAFWMQPPLVRTSALGVRDTSFAEPDKKASNSRQVTIDPQKKCTTCPANDPSVKPFAEPKTDFKNTRQEEIFWHIIDNYPAHGFDCCYVRNEQFHKEVNRFAYPESINLINSERLMKLNLELQNLNKSMTRPQVNATNFVALLSQLEPLDWVFLNEPKLSKPFWDALRAAAPGFLYKGVQTLALKGAKKPLTGADINKALPGK